MFNKSLKESLFTKMFLENANKGYIDIALPPTFFYPLGISQVQNEKFAAKASGKDFHEQVKKRVVQPETITVHWWDGSWTSPDAQVKA